MGILQNISGSQNEWWNPDAIASGKIQGLFSGNDDTQDTSAEDAYAAMTRQGWYNYMNTIGVPQENKLIAYATDPATVTDAMSSASSDATSAFDNQAANTQRNLTSLGLSLSPDEKAASDRDTNVARSLADVGAQNTARDQTMARQQAILGNPAPTLGGLS